MSLLVFTDPDLPLFDWCSRRIVLDGMTRRLDLDGIGFRGPQYRWPLRDWRKLLVVALLGHRALAPFGRAMGPELDDVTRAQLVRGEAVWRSLDQGPLEPQAIEEQVAQVYAACSGVELASEGLSERLDAVDGTRLADIRRTLGLRGKLRLRLDLALEGLAGGM